MSFSPPVQPGRVVEPSGGGSTAWIVLVALASLLAVCALSVAVARRKRAEPA